MFLAYPSHPRACDHEAQACVQLLTPHVHCVLHQDSMSLPHVLGPHCPPWKFVWSEASPPQPLPLFISSTVAFQQQNKNQKCLVGRTERTKKANFSFRKSGTEKNAIILTHSFQNNSYHLR